MYPKTAVVPCRSMNDLSLSVFKSVFGKSPESDAYKTAFKSTAVILAVLISENGFEGSTIDCMDMLPRTIYEIHPPFRGDTCNLDRDSAKGASVAFGYHDGTAASTTSSMVVQGSLASVT